MKIKTQRSKFMGCNKSTSKKKVYSTTSESQKARKIPNKKLSHTLKVTREATNKSKS